MARQRFGGAHTTTKLEKLTDYLKAFTLALKNQRFECAYLDAFAGTGDIEVADSPLLLSDGADTSGFVEGSVRRALAVDPPFANYTFVELSKSKAQQLRKVLGEFPNRKSTVVVGDANDGIKKFVDDSNWARTRAVVFLDPFGNQVSWESLERLAATDAVDVWYLFPSGLGVLRQIGRDGKVDATHRASLDRLFGTNDWDKVLLKKAARTDLFGEIDDQVEYRASATEITNYMRERMGTIFKGGVNAATLPLGSRNVHMYSLMFACANPSPRASTLAHKLAGHVLTSASRRSPRA